MRDDETYFIIFPGGDRDKISIVGLTDAMRYEIDDYARASRNEWSNEDECVEYAKQLAKDNDKEYIGNEDGFLD